MADPRVLVVDDDDGVRRVVRRALERAGVSSIEAADGEQALALVDGAEVDAEIEVMVLDWHLPGISGLDVLRHVRNDGIDAHIIVFTGAGTDLDREQAMAAGADDYLFKTVAMPELVGRVAAALDGRRTRPPTDPGMNVDEGADSPVRAIAHDLQNVFTVLTGYTELVISSLQDGEPRDDRALLDDLQMIADASRRGAELTARLVGSDRHSESATVDVDVDDDQPSGGLVLLVEDDADLRRVTERILTAGGYAVLSAADTETALALHRARHDEITVVLTDAVVPGSDPGAVAARLAAIDPTLPVLLMSGYGDAVHRLAPELDPRTTILSKPFSGEVLLAEIRRTLDGTSAG